MKTTIYTVTEWTEDADVLPYNVVYATFEEAVESARGEHLEHLNAALQDEPNLAEVVALRGSIQRLTDLVITEEPCGLTEFESTGSCFMIRTATLNS